MSKRKRRPSLGTPRHRQRAFGVSSEDLLIETQDPTSLDWNLVSSSPVTAYFPDTWSSNMDDMVTKGKYHYNDCSHEKTRGSYGVYDESSGKRFHPLVIPYNNPGFNTRLKAPCGSIIWKMRELHGQSFGRPFGKDRVVKWLEDRQLPTVIVIDRDPMESSFSIWFLAVDIIQLPKLVIQLFSRPIMRRRDFGAKSIKQLADDQLAKKFGVMATWRDLCDFVVILKRIYNGVEEMEKLKSLIFRWHGHIDDVTEAVPEINLPGPGGLTPNVYRVPYFGVDVGVCPLYSIDSCNFHRTMAYRVKCPELKTWLSRLKQMIDLLGVLDPAALWDVIPFSFIVDWFFDIGGWLHKHKPRLFEGSLEVVDYCEAIKLRYSSEWLAGGLGGGWSDVPTSDAAPWTPVSSIADESNSVYVRRRLVPDAATFGQREEGGHPLLSINRAVISGLLVAQRIPRPGLIGDLFEGISWKPTDAPPPGDKMAELEHAANVSYAEKERLNRKGKVASLEKFELSRARSARPAEHLSRVQRRGARGQILYWNMRKQRR